MDLNSFDDTNESLSLSLTLSAIGIQPRIFIAFKSSPSLSRAEEESFLFVCDRDLRRKQCACMKHFFILLIHTKSLLEKVLLFVRFLIRSCALLEISFDLIFLLFFGWSKIREGKKNKNKKHVIKRHA